jgi:predicted MPP superfamily phosphohydrolase
MPLFIIVILSLFVLGDLLWAAWAVSQLRKPGVRSTRWMWLGLAVMTVFLLLTLGSLTASIVGRGTGQSFAIPKVLQIAVFVWHLFILPLTLVLLSGGVILTRVAGFFARRGRPATVAPPAAEPSEATQLSRRRLLAMTAAVVPPVTVAAVTGISYSRLDQYRVREFTVPVDDLPIDLDGLTIAHLSDTHLGEFTTPRIYRQLIDATNALRADLIVHTGDVINVDANDIPEAMAGLARLDARLGVFVCEGNHDLIQSPRRFWDAIRKVPNVRFLRNDTATVIHRGSPLQLFGLRWGTRDSARIERRSTSAADAAIEAACDDLADSVEKDAFPLLLAHHPHAFDFAPWAKLTLAGHTHGGQLNITKHLSPGYLMYRYWSGLYHTDDRRSLVVSNGAGNWFPLRINAPAEIVKLTLRRA